MKANQAHHRVATMCRVLGVSASGYYAWRSRGRSHRAKRDEELCATIRTIHKTSRGTYGAPRVHAELGNQGCRVGRKRVARLMRESGLAGVSRRRGTRTTRREPGHRAAPDRVERQFTAEAPDRIWVADITYVPTWTGFLYLAIVLDVFSRKVVGWAMANHLRTELVLAALNMAIGQRRPQSVIHHSDKGAQYTSLAFGKRCRETGVVTSTGSAGDCYDNAMAESFFATLECELLDRCSFQTQAEARMAIFEYLESWYNTRRLHSALGYLSPNEFERRRGHATPNGHRGSSRTNQPRTLPDRPAGDPQPPSGGTLNTALRERVHAIGYRSPQCRCRQPSTVHRIGVGPSMRSATSGSKCRVRSRLTTR